MNRNTNIILIFVVAAIAILSVATATKNSEGLTKVQMVTIEQEPEEQPEEEEPQEEPQEEAYEYTTYYTPSEEESKEYIAQRESGGDYEAVNGRYYGRYQLDEAYLDGDFSIENQEATAEAYVADRYGSWAAAYEHFQNYGWY